MSRKIIISVKFYCNYIFKKYPHMMLIRLFKELSNTNKGEKILNNCSACRISPLCNRDT